MTDTAPPWLLTMRVLTGTEERPGSADNPTILMWRDEIARRYPEMASYVKGYTADSIPWCGLAAAYCMAANGVRPPFGKSDTDRFLWANSWAKWGTKLATPKLGCVMVFTRNGGGHVSFYEDEDANSYVVRGGNQSDAVTVTRMAKSQFTAAVWPPEPVSLRDDASARLLPRAANIPAPPMPASLSRFGFVIPLLLESEGGNDDDPHDPGGRTSRGITQQRWDEWRQTRPGLAADVWQAPQDQVLAIYREKYWNVLRCDDLPPGVDYAVFDFGVNSGPSRSAKFLQRIVGTTQDGIVGPNTIAATHNADPASVINRMCAGRMAFLRGLQTWPTFGKGWSARVDRVRKDALAMVTVTQIQQESPMTDTVSPSLPSSASPAEVMADLIAARVQAKLYQPETKASMSAIFSTLFSGLVTQSPLLGIGLFVAQQYLASAGVMGTLAGATATPTAQNVGTTAGAIFVGGLVNLARRALQVLTSKPDAPK